MGQCRICKKNSILISSQLGICLQCIRAKPDEALAITDKVHEESRGKFGLPPKPPKKPSGVLCGVCANECKISMGERGFCGLVFNVDGKLVRMGGTPDKGVLQWYYDPLPTNCVSWWFCPGCTGAGYPKYAYNKTAETGYANLAVFYGSCSLDCLFCQNWQYRDLSAKLSPVMSAESLAAKADSHVSCICYFGGDPSVQSPHALKTSELALKRAEDEKRILRICWETNGYWKKEPLQKAVQLSFVSGGNIKFDLKTWNENLSKTLCSGSNLPTLENFKIIAEKYFKQRSDLPILTASTLLVPGYVDKEEVQGIAKFISEFDSQIPYTLLAFYPQYVMADLPTTSREYAQKCYQTAKRYLKNVRIGNVNLLS